MVPKIKNCILPEKKNMHFGQEWFKSIYKYLHNFILDSKM